MELELSFILAASCSWTGDLLQNAADIESASGLDASAITSWN
jgi:hypothetical protein